MADEEENPKARAARYRKMAAEAASVASESAFPHELREQHLMLAKLWIVLAKNTEAEREG